MQKIKKLKTIIFLYAIVHFSFMFFYTPLTGMFDFYPLFTWNIFRPYPEKIVWHGVVLIRQLNGQTIDPPKELIDLPDELFGHISYYNYTHRIQLWCEALKNKNQQEADRLQKEMHADFLLKNRDVVYQLKSIKINPINYRQKKEVIDYILLGEWSVKREI